MNQNVPSAQPSPTWLRALTSPVTSGASTQTDYADGLAHVRELMGQHSAPQGIAVPWSEVAIGATALLQHDKDLKVIAYLLLAQTHVGGIQALAVGLAGLANLVDDHWQALTPPISRLRGRLAALSWLHEELSQLLRLQEPATHDELAALSHAAAALDDALAAHCDVQGMQFLQAVKQLPERALMPAPSLAQTAPQQLPADAEQTPKSPAAQPTAPAELPAITELVALGAALLQTADAGLADDTMHAAALRLRRQGLWLHITQAPAATAPNERSTIPPLSQTDLQHLRDLEAQSRWHELLRVSEALMPRNRLQLGLQRLSGCALMHLGDAGKNASLAIAAETLGLLARLPELCQTLASDGTKLLDDATRAWLTQAVPHLLTPHGTAAPKLADPTSAGAPAVSPRSQMLDQLRQAEAWHGPPEVAHAALYALSYRAHVHRLEQWEPELAVQIFTAELHALQNLKPSPKRHARTLRLLGRIAALDFGHAHSLDLTQIAQGA